MAEEESNTLGEMVQYYESHREDIERDIARQRDEQTFVQNTFLADLETVHQVAESVPTPEPPIEKVVNNKSPTKARYIPPLAQRALDKVEEMKKRRSQQENADMDI